MGQLGVGQTLGQPVFGHPLYGTTAFSGQGIGTPSPVFQGFGVQGLQGQLAGLSNPALQQFGPGYAGAATAMLGAGVKPWGALAQQAMTRLPNDDEIEEIIYEALDNDPVIPWNAEIEVRVDTGQVTLTGTVPNKRIKHAAGEIAWWVPGVVDLQNNIVVASRRRARGKIPRGPEAGAPGQAEKRK
jgi:hypothetical protein